MTHQLRVLADIHMAYTDMHAHTDTCSHMRAHIHMWTQNKNKSKKLEEKWLLGLSDNYLREYNKILNSKRKIFKSFKGDMNVLFWQKRTDSV